MYYGEMARNNAKALLPQFSKGCQSIRVQGTKGKIFFPKLSIFWLINLIQEKYFSLSIPSPIANLYSLLQFPSTSFTKYIIIYSFPQATISRDTFPIVGISQINHPIWIFFLQYIQCWEHTGEGYKSQNSTLKCQHIWSVGLRCRMTPKGKVNHLFGLLSLQNDFTNVFVKIITLPHPK